MLNTAAAILVLFTKHKQFSTRQCIPQREGCVCGGGCVFCRPVVVVGWSELQVDVLVSRGGDDGKSDGCVSV